MTTDRAASGNGSEKKIRAVQCWDDGVVPDIRVMEICRKYGAKASFNLNAGLPRAERQHNPQRPTADKLSLPELKSVYEGFLVANHSLTHPHLEQIPIEQATREIRDGRDALEQIFGYPVLGFVYPFGTYNDAVCEAVRAAGHVYARVAGNADDVFPPADPMLFHPNCHFLAADFERRFAHVKENGGVFYFWGHSYEVVEESQWETFEGRIAALSADPDVTWVDLPELFA